MAVLLSAGAVTTAGAQVTGLKGWTIYLDPGHSRQENMGYAGYSEAEKVLRVGLALREMLLTQTDIDTVYISRTNDQQLVSLSDRSTHANTVNADFFYSIHSDAPSTTANSTLLMYGGWRENGQTIEKTPQGGKKMGDIMTVDLTAAMRTNTRGNYADRTFYQGFPENHTNTWPYLHVNRETIMASVLSEAGFHTNPTQNMRNMNAEWKRLEAQSAFWSVLTYNELEHPPVGIAAGYLSNIESGQLINGATITINGQSYTTDTYESLFHNWSDDPEQLRNGFYYIENLPYGDTLDVFVEAPDYYPDTSKIYIRSDFFSFKDLRLLSSKSPYVTQTEPADGAEGIRPTTGWVRIYFSRPMNRESVLPSISISPEIEELQWFWTSDHTQLGFRRGELDYSTEYTITIGEGPEDVHGHLFDGNRDGEPGGIFSFSFTTGPEDITPPVLVKSYPDHVSQETDVPRRPIIRLEYDEEIVGESVTEESVRLLGPDDTEVPGTVTPYLVGERTVIHFFPSENLQKGEEYTVVVADGLRDISGNATPNQLQFSFRTGWTDILEVVSIDNFNAGVGSWWQPLASGSTVGYISEETYRQHDTETVNILTGSTGSMQIHYGWDTAATSHLIRVHSPQGTDATAVKFDVSYILQAFVFGDGSGNRIRFVLEDGPGHLEASQWYTVDWIGWKLVEWDLAHDPVFGWARGGNGVLEGTLAAESFQLTYTQGSDNIGFINIDNYRVVKKVTVGVEDIAGSIPQHYRLEQNYPNPFNPSTSIGYSVPEQSHVKIEVFNLLGQRMTTLVNESHTAGNYEVTWHPTGASGTYLYRIEAVSSADPGNRFIEVKRMVLLR
jgi:N-acetylmuramoyl-L-alanine amidase